MNTQVTCVLVLPVTTRVPVQQLLSSMNNEHSRDVRSRGQDTVPTLKKSTGQKQFYPRTPTQRRTSPGIP